MFLLTIEGVGEQIKEHPYYLSKRGSYRTKFLNKITLVFHQILNSNASRGITDLNEFKDVSLSSEILKDLCGNKEYYKIKDILINDLKLIECTKETYLFPNKKTKGNGNTTINQTRHEQGLESLSGFTKRYALTNKAKSLGKVVKVGLWDKRLQRLIKEAKIKKIAKYEKNPILKTILHNSYDVYFDKEVIDKAHQDLIESGTKSREELDYYDNVRNNLLDYSKYFKRSKVITSNGFFCEYSTKERGGRLHYPITSVPRVFMPAIRVRGGAKLYELDAKNCFPLILVLTYAEKNGFDLNNLREDDEYIINSVLTGTYYNTIADECDKYGYKYLKDLYYKDKAEFKKIALSTLFAPYISKSNRLKDNDVEFQDRCNMLTVMENIFPNFCKYMMNYKRKFKYQLFSIQSQVVESDIFIREFFALNETPGLDNFAIPRHDSILTIKENVERYRILLAEIFKKKFKRIDIPVETYIDLIDVKCYE